MARQQNLLAPPSAAGWTHIWDGGYEQYPITDEQAASLVMMGIIEYSPDDGPNARVYRPVKNWDEENVWTLERIKKLLPQREVAEVAA